MVKANTMLKLMEAENKKHKEQARQEKQALLDAKKKKEHRIDLKVLWKAFREKQRG